LVISRDRKGEENPGLYLQKPSGGPLLEIQHKKGVQTGYAFTSEDSTWIYFTSNDEKPDSYTIYRYNIRTGAKEKVFGDPGIWGIADMSRDGRKILLEKATGSLRTEVYEYDQIEKKLTPLFGQGEAEDYGVSYSANEGELLVKTNKFSNFYRGYTWKAGKFQPITPEIKKDVEELFIDQARKRIYYLVNDEGYTVLSVLDGKTLKPVTLPKLPKADHVFVGSLSRDGRFATLGVETGRAPRTSFVLDWESGKLTQWVLPSAPEVKTTEFAEAKLEFYKARDGVKIPMFVRRPLKCDSPCPVIVHFHGGPEGQSQPGFSTYSQIFVENGYIYVEPNVRGSSGYGKEWLHSDNGGKRLNVITDIEDAAAFIKKEWAVNGRAPKVGVMGYSYGGYSTLVAMTMFGGAYNAGAALVGMSNLYTFLQNTAPYRRILRATEYGNPETEKDILLKLSPVTYLDRVKDPLMIIQGASDPRVPAGEAIQIHNQLEAKGVPNQLIIFADEGHGSAKRDNRVLEIGHLIRFFNSHLKTQSGTPKPAG
ncbi:MAG: prolyl oligopeptidase family serine peptidase, partial [Bdellovibrionia bacterium]